MGRSELTSDRKYAMLVERNKSEKQRLDCYPTDRTRIAKGR